MDLLYSLAKVDCIHELIKNKGGVYYDSYYRHNNTHNYNSQGVSQNV